jgi:hypothetical protein
VLDVIFVVRDVNSHGSGNDTWACDGTLVTLFLLSFSSAGRCSLCFPHLDFRKKNLRFGA